MVRIWPGDKALPPRGEVRRVRISRGFGYIGVEPGLERQGEVERDPVLVMDEEARRHLLEAMNAVRP